jgi:hypothetical protein
MPPMPPMPPMPTTPVSPMPPAPADYTQQLFSYLQAWRQYLEQMTGATPGSPQPSTAQPANGWDTRVDYGGEATPVRLQGEPSSSGDDTGSGSTPGGNVVKGSSPVLPPHLVPLAPHSDVGAQDPAPPQRPPGLSTPANEVQQVLRRPGYDYGYLADPFRPAPSLASAISSARPEASRDAPEAPAQRPKGSPFLSAMGRVGPNVSPQVAPRSLFSSRSAQKASARFREAGQTPSP